MYSYRSLVVVTTGAFLTSLTSSVLNVALPDIARSFHIDPAHASWFVLSFLLAVTIVLLPAGRMSDIVGHGRVYKAGLAVFVLGSMGCGLSVSPQWLILGRVLQGFGAALSMASSPALLTLGLPPERRGFALGVLSTATYVGLALGPPFGGMLVASWGWRAVFWVSATLALVTLGIARAVLPAVIRPATSQPRADWVGATLGAVALVSFMLVPTRGFAWGWTSPAVLLCAGLALAGFVAFFHWESRHPTPMLDLRLFRSFVFSGACASALLNYIALFVSLFLLPFALRDGQGLSAPQVGQVLAAQAVAMALVAGFSGALSDRIGTRGLATVGMLVLAVSMGGLAWVWPTHGVLQPALWLFACGSGTGLFISPNSSSLMGAAPREKQGVAGGIMSLVRNLGMSLGVALGSGLFSLGLSQQVGPVRWTSHADQLVRLGLATGAALALLSAVVVAVSRPKLSRQPG